MSSHSDFITRNHDKNFLSNERLYLAILLAILLEHCSANQNLEQQLMAVQRSISFPNGSMQRHMQNLDDHLFSHSADRVFCHPNEMHLELARLHRMCARRHVAY